MGKMFASGRRGVAFCAAIVMPAFAVSAQAQQTAKPLTGTWRGAYVCAQGQTGLTLTVDRLSGPDFSGFFHFYPPRRNSAAKEGCFAVKGRVEADRSVIVEAGEWMTRPPGYITVDLLGTLGRAGLLQVLRRGRLASSVAKEAAISPQ